MTPAEKVVAEAIRQEREDHALELLHAGISPAALQPRVLARTGVSVQTYWRALHVVNAEDVAVS